MEGLGDRIRTRTKQLGLTDAEVARRLDLTQSRYGKYVRDVREPDLATLVRLCRVLDCSLNDLLIGTEDKPESTELLRARCVSALTMLDQAQAELIVGMVEAAARNATKVSP